MLELLSLLTFVLILWTAIFDFPASSNVHLLLEVFFMKTGRVALMIGLAMVFVQVECPNVLMYVPISALAVTCYVALILSGC